MRTQLATIVVLATLVAPRLVSAQETPQEWRGLVTSELSTVYVLDDAGAETAGKLVRLNPDSIVILVDGNERRFDAARVKRVQKRGDSVKNGAIIGAIVGAVLGGISAGIADCPGSESDCGGFRVAAVAISTGVYTAIGAGIDALVAGRTTLYSAPPPPARGASGGAAFRVSVRVPIGTKR
jgi:hypothetical protein